MRRRSLRVFRKPPGERRSETAARRFRIKNDDSCRTPCRSMAGSSTWRAGRRRITFCQSCQGSAQPFGGNLSQSESPQRTRKGVRTVGSAAFWALCRRGQRASRPEARNSPSRLGKPKRPLEKKKEYFKSKKGAARLGGTFFAEFREDFRCSYRPHRAPGRRWGPPQERRPWRPRGQPQERARRGDRPARLRTWARPGGRGPG